MDINKYVTPVVLIYLEPGWAEKTAYCLLKAGFTMSNVRTVDREGVGSMSKAFNRAMFDQTITTPYVWWVTNIEFEPDVPTKLFEALEYKPNVAAIHPGFASDHPHIRNSQRLELAPFVEFTAPMFNYDALHEIGPADEALPYIGMDIDWSYRAKEKGFDLMVDGSTKIEHTYLHQGQGHTISKIRAALRSYHIPATYARLEQKYGPDWKTKICPGGAC